jgi:transcriptional regulator with XRE-family HTH domain
MPNQFFKNIIDTNPQHLKDEVGFHIEFVKRVKEILHQKNMTQKQLAHDLNKKQSEISKFLSGKHNFTISSIFKLAAILEEPLIEVSKVKTPKPVFSGNCKVYSSEKPLREVNFKFAALNNTITKRTFVSSEKLEKTAL